MSLVTELACVACGRVVEPGTAMTCPVCGPDAGILDVRYDLAAARHTLTRESLDVRLPNHWRYSELLPLDQEPPSSVAHIGWTPMIEAPRLAEALGVRRLRLKDDTRSASASFKDRASAVGVAHAVATGFRSIACASTGNAASSLACCAAAAGLRANIFVGQRVPTGKLAQLLAYGARVFKVRGSYADAYDLSMRACERFGWYNRNCAVNPYLVEGKKTGGLEIAEQCADDPPNWVVCSVGDGCSIAGVWKGLAQMNAVGVVDWTPRMLGVQAEGVAPICRAMETDTLDADVTGDTYADSINVPVPRNWRKAINAVRDSEGALITATDNQIMNAVRTTGRLAGVFAEPAAAAAIAGLAEGRRRGIVAPDASVVAVVTGNGLKDIDGALRAAGSPIEIDPDFDEVTRVVERDMAEGAD